jgi:putative membrane protein
LVTKLNPLTTIERERIDAAMKTAGARTSADFALIIVPVSDRYTLYPLLWSAIIALSVTGIVALLRPGYSVQTGFIIDSALFIALALAFDWMPIRMWLVPAEVKRSHARQLAHREFAVRIVAPGTRRTGVMFFVSVGERYAEILADRDTHAHAPDAIWNKIVDRFLDAVKAGRLADGVVDAVEACGAILEEHHPPPVS